jgi:predicted dehydrogenase
MGCDVITEKPMTIDEARCRRIIDTQRRTRKRCAVTFNYRYSPPRTQVKELLMSGVIGDVISVDFHWMLDTSHGADYFRRWHRNKANSGGLLVHKATHHFDLVNWWLSAVPVSVYAVGKRQFYTPEQAERYGLSRRAERCLDCPEAAGCAFYLDMRSKEGLRNLYLEPEKFDRYFRDQCVFSPEIDIEDTMHAIVTYDSRASMSYSLHAFMPWEGYVIVFNGSRGRLEHRCEETVYINGDGSVPGELIAEGTTIKIFPHFQPAYSVPIRQAVGGHGGGDSRLLLDVFGASSEKDPTLRAADQRAGAYSILTGVAANRSIRTGLPVLVSDLVPGLDRPDYPPMPSPKDPTPMPTAKGRIVSPEEALRRKREPPQGP